MTYQEYLQSDKWKTISAQRLALDNHECVLCGGVAENVHHRRYPKALGEEMINDLVSLCRQCHALHHGKEYAVGYKVPRVPPTQEMGRVMDDMRDAEKAGDDGRACDLLSLYCNLRRSQVVGA